MTHNDILNFLADRPAINQTKLMEELGYDRRNWYALKRGVRQVPKAKRGKFLEVLEKYG